MSKANEKEIVFVDFKRLPNKSEIKKEDVEKALIKRKYSVEERKNGRKNFLSVMKSYEESRRKKL